MYNAGGNKPLWITESGYMTYTNRAEQGQYLTSLFNYTNSNLGWIPVHTWFCWSDGKVPRFGITGIDGRTPTESYTPFFRDACGVSNPSEIQLRPAIPVRTQGGVSCGGNPGTIGPERYIPCDQVTDIEPHPLRPYPGSPCGNISSPETTFCAMRPWAATSFTYLKNINYCTDGGVCLEREIAGNYSIDPNSELPLVSVTRDGFEDLTFFNRSQEHHADYLEGRAYYDDFAEADTSDGINDLSERIEIWNRLGIFRKLAPLSLQDNLKKTNILNASSLIHNYIVSPDPYGVGAKIRMTDFIGHFPPTYTCTPLTDPLEKEQCKLDFFEDMEKLEKFYLWAILETRTYGYQGRCHWCLKRYS